MLVDRELFHHINELVRSCSAVAGLSPSFQGHFLFGGQKDFIFRGNLKAEFRFIDFRSCVGFQANTVNPAEQMLSLWNYPYYVQRKQDTVSSLLSYCYRGAPAAARGSQMDVNDAFEQGRSSFSSAVVCIYN